MDFQAIPSFESAVFLLLQGYFTNSKLVSSPASIPTQLSAVVDNVVVYSLTPSAYKGKRPVMVKIHRLLYQLQWCYWLISFWSVVVLIVKLGLVDTGYFREMQPESRNWRGRTPHPTNLLSSHHQWVKMRLTGRPNFRMKSYAFLYI